MVTLYADMPMPMDGNVVPSDAPGFGPEIDEGWVTHSDHAVGIKTLA